MTGIEGGAADYRTPKEATIVAIMTKQRWIKRWHLRIVSMLYVERAKLAERILVAYKNGNVCPDFDEAGKLYCCYGNTAILLVGDCWTQSIVGGCSSVTTIPIVCRIGTHYATGKDVLKVTEGAGMSQHFRYLPTFSQ